MSWKEWVFIWTAIMAVGASIAAGRLLYEFLKGVL